MKPLLLSSMRYVISGAIAYLLDVALFSLLFLCLQQTVFSANVLARTAGAVCAYGLNHCWTFKQPITAMSLSALRYLLLWILTTAVSTALLQFLNRLSVQPGDTLVLKLIIEACLIGGNFIVCKFWVFKSS